MSLPNCDGERKNPHFFCFKKATVKSGALLAYYFNLQSQHAMQS